MNDQPEALVAVLDQIHAGDDLHVKRVNRDGSLRSRVVGPALAAPSVDPAIGIDLLDGEPHIIRRPDGEVFGEITYLSVMRLNRIVATYGATQREGVDQ